jgi:hypothetical protein
LERLTLLLSARFLGCVCMHRATQLVCCPLPLHLRRLLLQAPLQLHDVPCCISIIIPSITEGAPQTRALCFARFQSNMGLGQLTLCQAACSLLFL